MQSETLFILKKPKIYVNVNIWNKIIGLSPSQSILRGDVITENGETKTSMGSMWIFGITRREETSVESQISTVIDPLYAKKEEIKYLAAEQGLIVSCETKVWFGEEDAFVDFGRDILKAFKI